MSEISNQNNNIFLEIKFEFLGIPQNKPMMENDLEKALVEHIEKFLFFPLLGDKIV